MGIQRITLYERDSLLNIEQRNTFYGGNLASSYADGLIIAGYIIEAWLNFLSDVLDVNYELYAYGVREVSIAHMPEIVNPLLPAGEGSVAGGTLPPQVAVYCSLRSIAAPPNKSPKWIGGIPEVHCVNGVPTLTLLTAVQNFLGDMLAASAAAPATQKLACAHYDAAEDRVTTANVATLSYVKPTFGTRRSRSVGVGI